VIASNFVASLSQTDENHCNTYLPQGHCGIKGTHCLNAELLVKTVLFCAGLQTPCGLLGAGPKTNTSIKKGKASCNT